MPSTLSRDPQTVAFAASSFLIGYLTYLCTTPPNPRPENPYSKDRIGKYVTSRGVVNCGRILAFFLWAYHGLLVLTPHHAPSSTCSRPQNLNPTLFTWTPYTVLWISISLVAAPIRLLTYAQLGKNFTFQLAKPRNLVTTGLYRYVQHPSYTTNLLLFVASVAMVLPFDGLIGCWLPTSIAERKELGVLIGVGLSMLALWGVKIRVTDEEEMLRREFGEEWETYHAKTKRFLPGLF